MTYKYKLVAGQENRQFIGGGVKKLPDGTVESPYAITSRFLTPIDEPDKAPVAESPASPVVPDEKTPSPVADTAPVPQPANQETK